MTDARTPPEPFFSTNVAASPANQASAKALRDPPLGLRVVIALYALALVAMVVAIAVLKAPGS